MPPIEQLAGVPDALDFVVLPDEEKKKALALLEEESMRFAKELAARMPLCVIQALNELRETKKKTEQQDKSAKKKAKKQHSDKSKSGDGVIVSVMAAAPLSGNATLVQPVKVALDPEQQRRNVKENREKKTVAFTNWIEEKHPEIKGLISLDVREKKEKKGSVLFFLLHMQKEFEKGDGVEELCSLLYFEQGDGRMDLCLSFCSAQNSSRFVASEGEASSKGCQCHR